MEQFAQGHPAPPTSGYKIAEEIPRKENVQGMMGLVFEFWSCHSELTPFDPHVGCTEDLCNDPMVVLTCPRLHPLQLPRITPVVPGSMANPIS